jgi:prepilin-type N-terminal cleavage/methylation domain-containing protein
VSAISAERRRGTRRFTLLELVVTIALVSIIASIGWVSTRDQLPRYRLQKAAKLMKNDVELVRHEAIFRGKEARLVLQQSGGTCDASTPATGAWLLQIGDQPTGSTKWDTFPADALDDGTDDDVGQGTIDLAAGGRATKHICLEDWGDLGVAPNQDAIVFNSRGWVRNPDDDYVSGFIGLTLVNTDARGRRETVELRIAKSGTTMLRTRY